MRHDINNKSIIFVQFCKKKLKNVYMLYIYICMCIGVCTHIYQRLYVAFFPYTYVDCNPYLLFFNIKLNVLSHLMSRRV